MLMYHNLMLGTTPRLYMLGKHTGLRNFGHFSDLLRFCCNQCHRKARTRVSPLHSTGIISRYTHRLIWELDRAQADERCRHRFPSAAGYQADVCLYRASRMVFATHGQF